jgi:hypothetical protein
MKTIIENKNANHSRTILGAIILVIGTFLLADQLNWFFIPDWIFSWPMILVLIGLYSGVKHNFQNLGWLVWIFIGGVFLADDALPGLNIEDFAWPAGLIILGAYLITRRSFQRRI